MKRKKVILRCIAILLILMGSACGVDMLINLLNPSVVLDSGGIVFSLFVTGIQLLLGNIILSFNINSPKLMKKFSFTLVIVMFLFYTITVTNVIFGNGTFQRYYGNENSFNSISDSINFIPFRSIISYIHDLFCCTNLRIALENLMGNLILFAPMGFFLPYLEKRAKRFSWFAGELSGMLVLVELVQFVTARGICDVDDVMLNFIGAVGVWYICKSTLGRKVLNFIGFGAKNS